MASGLGSADLFRMLGSFALVLALMAALLWALRKLQTRMISQGSDRRMQIVESLSVGPRQKFALLRVGEHEVLVGITPTQMSSLGEWPVHSNNDTPSHATPSATGETHVA